MRSQRPIVVQVVHNEPIVGAGIVTLLSGAADLIVSSTGGGHAAQLVSKAVPEICDVVIADHAKALSLAAMAKLGRQVASAPSILVVTAMDREWDVRVAMEAGVHGYVLQKSGREQLVEAVQAVARGSKYLSLELSSKLAESLTRNKLTSRQLEVLWAMSTGASNHEISTVLGVSDATVKAHVSAILEKFGACARTEAVAMAAERGLIPRQDEGMATDHHGPGRLAVRRGDASPARVFSLR